MLSLEEIPSGIGEITTLRSICAAFCNDSVNDSAKRILEKQQSMRNEGVQLNVITNIGDPVPPMGLFYPMLLVPDVYPPPPRTCDNEDMLEDTWEFPKRSDISDGYYPGLSYGFVLPDTFGSRCLPSTTTDLMMLIHLSIFLTKLVEVPMCSDNEDMLEDTWEFPRRSDISDGYYPVNMMFYDYPMGLFYPMLLVPDVYPSPPRTCDNEDMLEDTWEFPEDPTFQMVITLEKVDFILCGKTTLYFNRGQRNRILSVWPMLLQKVFVQQYALDTYYALLLTLHDVADMLIFFWLGYGF
ncbi:hypothetical protein BUALT_Bualt07G0022000 [Buddleja alternifolia]|uniref:Uncharacterized protein n=1 Tax=Buddleja alternifolia TaxID=168488 RepID=A0AAV6X796_9LAMI|nr:hypothetical protein BUALT_Bualt07G0022000 [Buddleja alternifolia]